MSSRAAGVAGRTPARPDLVPIGWIISAHVLAALAVGVLEAVRLDRIGLALAIPPVFAFTGFIVGGVVAVVSLLVRRAPWWFVALALCAPSAAVTAPVCATLFNGAFAQTLSYAKYAPWALPLVLWVVSAIGIAIGRRILRSGDLIWRAMVVLVLAATASGMVYAERELLRTGYPGAHQGVTIAILVVLGVALRITRRTTVPVAFAAAIAGLAVGTGAAAACYGLQMPADRERLATFGDQSRDLVATWRWLVDFDRDGASPILGGGDCDDFDPAIHPGAIDIPGDGIDQNCDGLDAMPAPPPPPKPKPLDLDGWRGSPAVQAVLARTKSMNVLLITVDALRFDLLAPGAADRADFPHIAKLLDESVWFTHAIAPASGTDVSLSTLLTGRFDPYQPTRATLIDALHALGRQTSAAIPGEVTRFVGDTLIRRGVDHFTTVRTDGQVEDVGDHVSAAATTDVGVKAVDTEPYLVWLHYFDVHEHHQIDVPKPLLGLVHDGGSPVAHGYRALLHAIDDGVGQVLAELDARHEADHTIIVFLSDHGESLGEDRRFPETHGEVTYGPLVRIPFAIHVPGVAPGQRVDPVSLVDIAPTLLDLLGSATAMAPLDGTDLVPALLDAPPALRVAERAIALHEEKQHGAVVWPYHVIVKPADNLTELYDLERDPGEHEDLAAQHPDIVNRLLALYAAIPEVRVDRSPAGKTFREQQGRPPQPPAQP